MSLQVLYIGRVPRRLERLLDESNSVSVTVVPTVAAAVEWLAVAAPACMVRDAEPDPDTDLERLVSV
ncbi:MAG: hypothetical protein QXG03_06870, partial [Halalkalicoccus sp.]